MVGLEKRESWSWRMEGNGRQGPSGSDLASPVSRAEIDERRRVRDRISEYGMVLEIGDQGV